MTTEHDTKPITPVHTVEHVPGYGTFNDAEMEECADGEWIRYDDHAKAITNLETRLAAAEHQAELARARDDNT